MRRHTRAGTPLRLTAVLVALAAALGGCGGDARPARYGGYCGRPGY